MRNTGKAAVRPKMKLWKKIVIGALAVPVVLAGVIAAVYFYADNRRDIKTGYNQEIETGGELEAKYLAGGDFRTKKYTAKADDPIKKYTVYYPAELGSTDQPYPMILVLNGTGGKATKYEAQFELYASWGFIVAGNQDKTTGTGVTAVETLHYMLEQNENPDSIFYHKIDLDNIGITGFSQGGAGVFNVLTKYEEASCFKAAAPLSPVSEYMTALVTDYTYESSEVSIPIMSFAGTEGEFETETVLPLTELKKQYDKITAPKVMARRVGMIHDQMMYSAGGYVIAWFRWQLMGDAEAAQVFIGESPELLSNPMYQDTAINID